MFKPTIDEVSQMLEEDPSLGTLRNQYTTEEIFDLIEDRETITTVEGLYEALMDVMYATRPKGVL